MIVPVEILEKLKCSNCEDLLSCGPVLLKHDGSNICGRCSNLEETAVPNIPYNELATLCAFPCKYEAEGCSEKVTFSSMIEHEEDCEFRSYICPVMPSGSCDWIGSRKMILEHTREAHPEKIVQNPCEMEHDVKTASLKTFLMTAFDVLFLIHIKVCLTTYSVYHSVRKIGALNGSYMFKYQLNIECDNGHLMRKGDVAPQGCLALQENTSIAIKINTMMEALNGFKNSKFIIKVQRHIICYKCKKTKNTNDKDIYHKINNALYCSNCLATLISCKNLTDGCLWKGTSEQILNHETFCPYTKCSTCSCNNQPKGNLPGTGGENEEPIKKIEPWRPRRFRELDSKNDIGRLSSNHDQEDKDDFSSTRNRSTNDRKFGSGRIRRVVMGGERNNDSNDGSSNSESSRTWRNPFGSQTDDPFEIDRDSD